MYLDIWIFFNFVCPKHKLKFFKMIIQEIAGSIKSWFENGSAEGPKRVDFLHILTCKRKWNQVTKRWS
jgi:hypothetical protein